MILEVDCHPGGTRYSGLDPMEDTESSIHMRSTWKVSNVTVGSIRWRILKATVRTTVQRRRKGYSGLDPMEDTESRRA